MTVATPTNSPITVHLRTGKWDRIGARAACRAMRDEVLRKLTGIDDPSRSIERSRFGKPFLPGVPDLNWSATSCAGFTAIAVCHGASVGLDAECVRPDLVDKTLIERCLAPEESDFAEVIAFDPDRFFDVWVRKEAALKQLGYGLHLEPNRIEVGLHRTSWNDCRVGGVRVNCVRSLESIGGVRVAVASIQPREVVLHLREAKDCAEHPASVVSGPEPAR